MPRQPLFVLVRPSKPLGGGGGGGGGGQACMYIYIFTQTCSGSRLSFCDGFLITLCIDSVCVHVSNRVIRSLDWLFQIYYLHVHIHVSDILL